jgi:hypothetical protein
MDKLDPKTDAGKHELAGIDLARRLGRFRRRVEAEGRQRSVRLIDRAIEDVDSQSSPPSGKIPK